LNLPLNLLAMLKMLSRSLYCLINYSLTLMLL